VEEHHLRIPGAIRRRAIPGQDLHPRRV
jgi:hypothetical protein